MIAVLETKKYQVSIMENLTIFPHSLWLMAMALVTISSGMTRYGEPCFNGCIKRRTLFNKDPSYYTCHKTKMYYENLILGTTENCSPSCGKTIKGSKCTDECETRGYRYYWCHVGQNGKDWEYCSRTGCPIRVPPLYQDCSARLVNKMIWLEYLYYPGYWLAKGYENEMAAVWKPKNGIDGKELFCPDEGYAWLVHGGKDGSVYLESKRPNYANYFFVGYGKETRNHILNGKRRKEERIYNVAVAVNLVDSTQYHETFAYRIMCHDCSTTEKCILWRHRDEFKLYTNNLGYLKMCKECGKNDWFNWRIHAPQNATFTCSGSIKISALSGFSQGILIISVILVVVEPYSWGY